MIAMPRIETPAFVELPWIRLFLAMLFGFRRARARSF
jgi:hypothetical protein